MRIVGIDMSLNSPGACIREDSKLEFISFVRGTNSDHQGKNQTGKHYRSLVGSINFAHTQPKEKVEGYSHVEIWKAMDAEKMCNTIMEQIGDVDYAAIEGFSYGSRGNSGLDLAGYSYVLRTLLAKKIGYEKVKIYAPSQIKKTAGKGNAGKPQIMEFFMGWQDEDLREHPLWKGLTDGTIDKIRKPIDDIVDAFFVQETLRRDIVSIINAKID